MRRILTVIIVTVLLLNGIGIGEATEETSQTLRVFSYNIRHGEGMDGRIDLARIAEVIARSKPDLVALQEVDQCCRRSGGQDIAKELGRLLGMEYRFGKFMDFQGGQYGLAVLSRFPIVRSVRHILPEGAEPRCALEVEVRVPALSGPLSFVSIHNDWKSEPVRVRQVQTLLDALKERQHPIILAGDFNSQRTDQSMKLLEEPQWNILDKGGKKTWPSVEPRSEIDFFVLRGLVAVSVKHDVIDEQLASDHRPIYAVLYF